MQQTWTLAQTDGANTTNEFAHRSGEQAIPHIGLLLLRDAERERERNAWTGEHAQLCPENLEREETSETDSANDIVADKGRRES
ncbi:unnamed protein product [Lampetra fluviatilis]